MAALLFFAAMFAGNSTMGAVTLSHVFSDHMVLQRQKPILIWGKASVGEAVEISLNSQMVKAVPDPKGEWKASLNAMEAGGPFVLEVRGSNTIDIQDVYVGEVWLASGESNMRFTVDQGLNASNEIAGANTPLIRIFTSNPQVAKTPQDDVDGAWQVASPLTVAKLSAVGYFFARDLQKALGVPIGILNPTFDSTPGESWTSRESLAAVPELKKDTLGRWDQIDKDYPKAKPKYDKAMAAWTAAGSKPTDQPKAPKDPLFFQRPAGLWNSGIAPLVPYGIRGVIWWQGETNAQRGYQYRALFKALIGGWRTAWADPALPFIWVQLPSVSPADPVPVESEWAEVREAQAMALASPHTGMAVGIDLGEPPDNLHPRNKQAFAHRLLLVALATVYGKNLDYSGPVYKSMKTEGNKIRLTFDDVNQGLSTLNGDPLAGFDIAGDDRKFVHAQSQIDGNDVLVWADGIPTPTAVRYAWANNASKANLYSRTRTGDNLPAPPFRTDQWPGKSINTIKMPVDD